MARLLKYKENVIIEEIHNTNSDIYNNDWNLAKNTDEDDTWTLSSELNNDSYQISTKNRIVRRGRRNSPCHMQEIHINNKTRNYKL